MPQLDKLTYFIKLALRVCALIERKKSGLGFFCFRFLEQISTLFFIALFCSVMLLLLIYRIKISRGF